MEEISITEAKAIMGQNFLGPEEATVFLQERKHAWKDVTIPAIPFSRQTLQDAAHEYLLVLSFPVAAEGWEINIANLRQEFGTDPALQEPCFYNQDWYMNETFITSTMPLQWHLLKKDVSENTRAVQPDQLIRQYDMHFPSAILCAYTFFCYQANYKQYLWQFDFVWCADRDHNDDRIYVGKYTDLEGINKNGFSIHRHLSLRSCYGAIEVKG